MLMHVEATLHGGHLQSMVVYGHLCMFCECQPTQLPNRKLGLLLSFTLQPLRYIRSGHPPRTAAALPPAAAPVSARLRKRRPAGRRSARRPRAAAKRCTEGTMAEDMGRRGCFWLKARPVFETKVCKVERSGTFSTVKSSVRKFCLLV